MMLKVTAEAEFAFAANPPAHVSVTVLLAANVLPVASVATICVPVGVIVSV